jgi:anaerobic dimethyl sulfoxide reductase subunit B (iron-sulfur subunit)
MACSVEHNLPIGRQGIVVQTIGPWEIEDDKWQYDHVPVPTDECDLCAARTALGEIPTCVKHCQADVMRFGTIVELANVLTSHPKQVLFSR